LPRKLLTAKNAKKPGKFAKAKKDTLPDEYS